MEGTPKQVEWAQKIIASTIEKIEAMKNEPAIMRHIAKGNKAAIEKAARIDMAIKNIGQIQMAATAIGNRDTSPQDWVRFFSSSENPIEAEIAANR